MYDGINLLNNPQGHTYSQSAAVPSYYDSYYFGTVVSNLKNVQTMLSDEPQPFCTSSWDCNRCGNCDKQDWKREGDYFYAVPITTVATGSGG